MHVGCLLFTHRPRTVCFYSPSSQVCGAVSLPVALQTALHAIASYNPLDATPMGFHTLHTGLWQLLAIYEGCRVTELMQLRHCDLYLNLDEISCGMWAEMWRQINGQHYASGGYKSRTPWLTLVLLR